MKQKRKTTRAKIGKKKKKRKIKIKKNKFNIIWHNIL